MTNATNINDIVAQIEKQPSFERLQKLYAEKIKPIFVWVGAGLSAPAGIPTWSVLRKHLEDALARKIMSIEYTDQNKMNIALTYIRSLSDFWMAFQILEQQLGAPDFRAIIRDTLSVKRGIDCPLLYEILWGMRIAGMITLNLDRFCSTSLPPHKKDTVCWIQDSKKLSSYIHVLNTGRPIIANLHGILDDADSWVFTANRLREIQGSQGYKTFLQSIFATHCVVFVGISADDAAAGGLVRELSQKNLDLGDHFWITSRLDAETDRWANSSGIKVIRYPTGVVQDQDVLSALCRRLESYVSHDSAPPVVVGSLETSARLPIDKDLLSVISTPSPADLAKKHPEEIRQALDLEARKRVRVCTTEDEKRQCISDLLREYAQAIHYSYFISPEFPNNTAFGYTIDEKIGEGAFGRVYKGHRDDVEYDVAIKIMRPEVLHDCEMLACFRRGIRSMQIISKSQQITQIAEYVQAHEFPPAVIMKYIPGINLDHAVHTTTWDRWRDGFRVALEVLRIVRACHMMPETVLHRDLRPANIIINHDESGNEQVFVLDFDLSWHRGASHVRSIEPDANYGTALAYLAPEQIYRDLRVSTRSASVDAHGFGMTLYFMFSGGQNPVHQQNANREWDEIVLREFTRGVQPRWRSLPVRLARLVVGATRWKQSERLDMGEIDRELSVISRTLLSDPVLSAELVAEEVMCRAFGPREYRWDNVHYGAKKSNASGVDITCGSNELSRDVVIVVDWSQRGRERWKDISKFLPKAKDKVCGMLTHCGFTVKQAEASAGMMHIRAICNVNELTKRIDDAARSIARIGEVMEFK